VSPEEHLHHLEPGTVFPFGLLHLKSDGICRLVSYLCKFPTIFKSRENTA
jgi:hypothetical protein